MRGLDVRQALHRQFHDRYSGDPPTRISKSLASVLPPSASISPERVTSRRVTQSCNYVLHLQQKGQPMRKVLRLAACVIVPLIANGIASAGPCEEGCAYNYTQCTNQANTNYSQCMQVADNCYTAPQSNYASCLEAASNQHYQCIQENEQQIHGACNSCYQTDVQNCDFLYQDALNYCFQNGGGNGQVYCEFQLQQDQQYCANDYGNCLFACSTQNP